MKGGKHAVRESFFSVSQRNRKQVLELIEYNEPRNTAFIQISAHLKDTLYDTNTAVKCFVAKKTSMQPNSVNTNTYGAIEGVRI